MKTSFRASCVVVSMLFLVMRECMATCDLPSLPTDLDLITSVESTSHREVHLHGMYRIGMDTFATASHAQVHNLTLLYTAAQEFRLSVFPHDALSLDLFLRTQGDQKMVMCAMKGGRGAERMMYALLKPNVKYVLSFQYSLAWSWGASQCPSIMMELATQPQKNAPNFHDACFSAGSLALPSIVPTPDAKYYYEYTTPSSTPLWVSLATNEDDTDDAEGANAGDDLIVVGSYPVTVPHIPGRHQRWKFVAKLQSRFLDGGDLSMMLTTGGLSRPPSLDGCANSSELCFSGTRAVRNHFILQDILWSDLDAQKDATYTLWVVRRPTPTGLTRTCAPVSFHISLFPLKEPESFVTCSVDPLPATFNAPGMYNNLTGTMLFSQSILVNLTTRMQEVRLQPTVPGKSLMRAYIGAHDELDIDLILLERPLQSTTPLVDGQSPFYSVAASMAIRGPEGIVVNVDDNHEYMLRVSIPYPFREYNGKDHDYYEFCDSYHLTVHVFPQQVEEGSSGSTTTCDNRPPIFSQLQETLNETQKFEFGMPNLKVYSFTYPLNVSERAQQETIQTIRFYIPADGMTVSAITYADAFSGAVQMTMLDESMGDGWKNEPLYSKRRSIGTSLVADVEEGWYTLTLLTPYMQSTHHTFKELFGATGYPSCVRYNMVLRIQARNSCLSALQLPEEYPMSSHEHRHVDDEYEIPIDGKHFMTLEPTHDIMMHILISASDIPVRIMLFAGDSSTIDNFDDLSKSTNLITSGSTVFGEASNTRSEIVAKLSAKKAYTLYFDFTFSADWSNAFYCSTFDLQMSVSKLFALSESEMNLCDQAPQMQEEIELGHIALPYFLGPQVFSVHPKGTNAADSSALSRSWSYSFIIKEKASIRANFEYDFTHHAFGMLLCKCDETTRDCGSCSEAYGYYNGLEVPTLELDRGAYILYIQPWSTGVFSGQSADDVYINFCTYVMLQMHVVPVVSKAAPPVLCSAMLQYLPATLNNVAFLSPYYNDEMHLFQEVLISKQHMADRTTLTLGEKSVLRVMSPEGGVQMSLRIVDVSQNVVKSVYSTNAALYVQLDAGSYEIRVHFYISQDALSNAPCRSVPMEISVMTAEDIQAISLSDAVCAGSLPFPTKPFFHGHDTLYRNPSAPFNKIIDFSIGELGGSAEFDVRYNFETSGLQVRFWGEMPSSDGSVVQRSFPWIFYPDRAYLARSLDEGTYHLQIMDPVESGNMYNKATTAGCIPYSLHLRSQDLGNYSHFTPIPSTMVPHGEITSAPELYCRFEHVDPFPTTFFRASGERTFAYASTALRIPFGSGEHVQVNIGQHLVPLMLAKRVVSFQATVTHSLRVWVRSTARVFLQVRLFDNAVRENDDATTEGGADAAVAVSESFGYHTQSLYFPMHRLSTNDDDFEDASLRDVRMEILFYYHEAPKYQTDYTECSEQTRLTTFELYAALFDEENAVVGTACNATLMGMPAVERLPPRQTVLGSSRLLVSGTYHMTQDEALKKSSGNRGSHGPHHRNDVTLPPAPPSGNAPWGGTARRMEALGVGDIPGVSDELRSDVDIAFNTTFVVPSGASGVRIMSHTKYPLHYINMRTALYASNQSDPLLEGFGTPMLSHDGAYQAESLLQLAKLTLGPGTYTVAFMVSNVLPLHPRQVYCIPFHWSLEVTADRYPGVAPAPPGPTTPPKPALLDLYPKQERGLDRSDPLLITFVLSEDAAMSLSMHQHFAMLQRDDNGDQVTPTAQYFDDTDRLVVLFGVNVLEWGCAYHLVFDATVLKTAVGGKTYDISDFVSQRQTYSTATCGCLGGSCVAGGGCGCVERGGDRCDACAKGFQLSDAPQIVGVGALQSRLRVCERLATSTPAPPTPPSDGATPAPHVVVPQTPQPSASPLTPAPEGNPSPTATPPSSAPAVDGAKPPLRFLRYGLAYGAMLVMLAYTASFLLRFRRRARQTLLSRNPFRGHANSGTSAMGTYVDDDEDEDMDDEAHNTPSVR